MPQIVEAGSVGRLMADAEQVMRGERTCWLAATTPQGGVRLRPMGMIGFKDWTVRFLTDARSAKAADLRVAERASVLCQREVDDSYVALSGRSALRTDREDIERRWKAAFDVFFPTPEDKAHAAFVEIAADCVELWLRGRTPEPFGQRTTTLRREGETWRLDG